MESFFLAETTKYLYLLFDPDHYLNNDGGIGTIINTPNGECVIDAGGYIFNTEAHPIDPSALRCCYDVPRQQLLVNDYDQSKYLGDVVRIALNDENENASESIVHESDSIENSIVDSEILRLTNLTTFNVNQLFRSEEAKNELLNFLNEMKTSSAVLKADQVTANDDIIVRKEFFTGNGNDTNKIDKEKNSTNMNRFLSTVKASNGTNKENSVKIEKVQSASNNNDDKKQKDLNESEKLNNGTTPERSFFKKTPDHIIDQTNAHNERKSFDPQQLIEHIRTIYNDTDITRNYELLTCKAQSFSQRLAVLGEILT